MVHLNYTTGKEYTGCNIGLLHDSLTESGYTSPLWATYRQFRGAGLQVQKGQTSTELKRVVVKKVKDENGKEVEKKLIKKFRVFNIEQTAPIVETKAA